MPQLRLANTAALLLLGALITVAPALAAAKTYRTPLPDSVLRTAAVETIRACAIEARRRCVARDAGPGGVLVCLYRSPIISRTCSRALGNAAPVIEALAECGPDIDRFCQGVALGRGRVVTCLADNWDRISDVCYTGLEIGAEAFRETY